MPTPEQSAEPSPGPADQSGPAAARAPASDEDVVFAERTPEQREEARAARARRRQRRRRRRRLRRLRRIGVALLVALVLLATAGFVWFRYTFGGLDRIPGALPAGHDTPGTTILLVGSDPGAHDEVPAGSTWRQDLGHSDLVMLLHVPASGDGLFAVSLPGTLRLPTRSAPTLASAAAGGGPGYVRVVEQATGVHVDRLAVLDLNSVREVVDELDGIRPVLAGGACGERAGPQRVDGQGAIALMRLRPCLPRGDLDRVAHQQAVFKALLARLVDGSTLTNPFALNRIAKSTFDHLAANEDWGLWDMAGLAWSLRDTTPRTTTFLTAPTRTAATGTITLDPRRAPDLWRALRQDRLASYVALNRDTVAGG